MERTAAQVSFGSRTRSVLGGLVLGGDYLNGGVGASVHSQWWSDLEGGGNVLQEVAGFRRRWALIGSGVQVSGSSSPSLSFSLSVQVG